MKMPDGLRGDFSGRANDVRPSGLSAALTPTSHSENRLREMRRQFTVDVPEIGHMNPWHNKRVAYGRGCERQERECVLALPDNASRRLATLDRAELTIGRRSWHGNLRGKR